MRIFRAFRLPRLSDLLICALGVLIALGIIEILLRCGIIPNQEFDRTRIAGPAAAQRRLLIMGDSFVRSEGALFAGLVRDLVPQGVALMNLSMNGAGPFEYVREYRRYGPGFAPQLVLLSYYAGNDLTDVQFHPRYVAQGADAFRERLSDMVSTLFLERYLSVLEQRLTLRWLINFNQIRQAGVPKALVQQAENGEINPWLLEQAQRNPRRFLDNLLIASDQNKAAWRKVTELIAELQQDALSHKAKLLLVAFPASLQLSQVHATFFRQLGYVISPEVFNSSRPQDLLREFCAAHGVPYLDLKPELSRHDAATLYRPNDEHLNDRGDAVAEAAIVEFIRGQF
jgi:hypothetical protein